MLIKVNMKDFLNYIDFLKNNEEFTTTFYDIGDGLAVSTWKNEK